MSSFKQNLPTSPISLYSMEKERQKGLLPLLICHGFSSFGFEILFSRTAYRASPTFGKIFKFHAGGDPPVRVTLGRIINVTAYTANISLHHHPPFL